MIEVDQWDGYQSQFNLIYKVPQCRRQGLKLKIHRNGRRWWNRLRESEKTAKSQFGIDEIAKNAKASIYFFPGRKKKIFGSHRMRIMSNGNKMKREREEEKCLQPYDRMWMKKKMRGMLDCGERKRARHLSSIGAFFNYFVTLKSSVHQFDWLCLRYRHERKGKNFPRFSIHIFVVDVAFILCWSDVFRFFSHFLHFSCLLVVVIVVSSSVWLQIAMRFKGTSHFLSSSSLLSSKRILFASFLI